MKSSVVAKIIVDQSRSIITCRTHAQTINFSSSSATVQTAKQKVNAQIEVVPESGTTSTRN